MSAFSSSRRSQPSPRDLGLAAAALIGLVLLGLFSGRLALTHYGKTVAELGIGIPILFGLGALIFRRPVYGVIAIGAALVAIPSYSARTIFHLTIHPMLLLAVLTAVVLLLRAVAGHRIRFSGIDVLVALFTLAMCLAVVFGPRSWKEASAQLWIWLAAYIGGRAIAGHRSLKPTLARTLVIGGALLTPFSIAEAAGLGNPFFNLGVGGPAAAWAHPDLRAGESFRVETSFGHPIAFSMFLAVAIVFALVLIGAAKSRRERLWWSGALVLLLVQEALTLSRAGWVVIGVSVLLLAAGRRKSRAEQAARRAIVVGVGLLIALALAVPSVAAVPLSLVGLQSDTADSAALTGTTQYRSGLYSAAFNGGVASLFGNKSSKLTNVVQVGNGSIDSEYLLLLDQWGGVATIAFLLIAVALTARALRDPVDEWDRAFTVTAVGSMVALASVALITNQEYLVWLLIGLSAAPRTLPGASPPALAGSNGHVETLPATGAPELAGVPTFRERTNLDVVVAALKRRWWLLVLCPLVVGGGAMAISKQQPVKYRATASMLFQVPNFSQILYGSSVDGLSPLPGRREATYVNLAKLPIVAQRTAKLIPGRTAAQIHSEVSVSELGGSDMYGLSVTDSSPRLAAVIANAYAHEFLRFRVETDRARITALSNIISGQLKALPAAQHDGPAGQKLQTRLYQLALVSALQNGGAQITSLANHPGFPSSPHNAKTAKYGAIIGLALGFILLFWIGRRDRRIRDAASVEDAYGLPLLGSVTDEQAPPIGSVLGYRSAATTAAFDRLRATLRHSYRGGPIRALMVASAGAREGRSTVALQLAIAEAAAGNRGVLLLEADLRRPTLAAALGTPTSPGLAEILSGAVTPADAVRHVRVSTGEEGSSATVEISLVPAGATPQNPLELLERPAMADVIDSLTESYDTVIIDTPALSLVADAMPLLSRVSGVVLVGRIGITTRRSAHVLRDQLKQVGATVLGVVATSVPAVRTHRWRMPSWRLRAPLPRPSRRPS